MICQLIVILQGKFLKLKLYSSDSVYSGFTDTSCYRLVLSAVSSFTSRTLFNHVVLQPGYLNAAKENKNNYTKDTRLVKLRAC